MTVDGTMRFAWSSTAFFTYILELLTPAWVTSVFVVFIAWYILPLGPLSFLVGFP